MRRQSSGPRIISAIATAVSLIACTQESKSESETEGAHLQKVYTKGFKDTVWYDSPLNGASIFLDFDAMRQGLASIDSESSDLDAHFGSPIIGCGNPQIHCMDAGYLFSLPKISSVEQWSIQDYTCTLSGNRIGGEVDCLIAGIGSKFRYRIVDGYIDQFHFFAEGYPIDTFRYEARNIGVPLEVIELF